MNKTHAAKTEKDLEVQNSRACRILQSILLNTKFNPILFNLGSDFNLNSKIEENTQLRKQFSQNMLQRKAFL